MPAVEGELEPGRFRAGAQQVAVYRRSFPSTTADRGGDLLVVDFDGDRVIGLKRAERPVREAWLDPPLIATYYGDALLERRPAPLAEIAPGTVRAVLAAEDASFFEHPGISFTGILRAVWVNLRGKGVMQGGSTVTQQLVKNIYLTSERTMSRKLREALLAVMLEWRYSKEQILEAYLNQIFWGRSGSANLIGVGAASAAYCGKEPRELSLAESALLAAMIRAPGSYHPVDDAPAARARRDFILDRLVALDWADRAAAEAAKREPLPTPVAPLSRRRAPYFVDAVAAEAQRRYGVGELADAGFVLLSTLDMGDQERAESAVREGLEELAGKSERVRSKKEPLQAALVSLEPATGAIRAWVGGRDFRESQFDRAGSARRQAGSAFKPLVYATAFERGVATPATLLEDAPLTLESGGKSWTPMNDDDQFHGWVTARTAVEQSYNLATIRLAIATGLPEIVATAKGLGLQANLRPVPSIAIGSFEVAPVELVTAYAAFANRGVRPDGADARRSSRRRRFAAGGDRRAGRGRRQDGALAADRLPRDDPAAGSGRLRHGAVDAHTGPGRPGGRQDRNLEQPARQLVRRLHAGARHGRLGRLRRRLPDAVLRFEGGAAVVDPFHARGAPGRGLLAVRGTGRNPRRTDRPGDRRARDRTLPGGALGGVPREPVAADRLPSARGKEQPADRPAAPRPGRAGTQGQRRLRLAEARLQPAAEALRAARLIGSGAGRAAVSAAARRSRTGAASRGVAGSEW